MKEWRAYIKHVFENGGNADLYIPAEYGGDENGRIFFPEDQHLEVHRIEILPPSLKTASVSLLSEKGIFFSTNLFPSKRYERYNTDRKPLAKVRELKAKASCPFFEGQNIEIRIFGQVIDGPIPSAG